jgi:leucyl/phenylalanyl-tRNA---protein transferase
VDTVEPLIHPDDLAALVSAITTPQVEVGPSRWATPEVHTADDNGLVAAGADLEVETLVAAYRSGMFPMPLGRRRLGWWSPDPRGVIPLDGLHVSRSLRRSMRHFRLTVDTEFTRVMELCGDPRRPHGWITPEFVAAYSELHRQGYAHSVEVRDDTGALVGGLYAVRVGRFVAGESMFHIATDASKAAVVGIISAMRAGGLSMFDVQWTTDHLCTLGAVDVARDDYLAALDAACATRT